MKRLAAAVALATLAALPASAEIIYVGTGYVTAATTDCGSSARPGDFARMTYRPAYAGFDNGADSYLAYVASRSSYGMIVPNNIFRALINYSGQSVGSTIAISTRVGGITNWAQTPPTPSRSTRTLNINATLANFWAITGCTVQLRINLLRVKSAPDDIVN